MSQTTPPPAAIGKLPVLPTVAEAYGRVLTQLALVCRAAAVPFALSLVIVGLGFAVHGSPILAGLLTIAGFVPYTIFGVAWHRLTLLGPLVGAPPLVPTWGRRHWRFLGYLVLVVVIGYGVGLVAVSLTLGVGAAAAAPNPLLALLPAALVIVLAYLMMRLSFVFPAVAVDEAYRLGHAWAHTKGQGLRLLAAVILASLPILALLWSVGLVFGALLVAEPGTGPGQEGLSPEAQMRAFVEANLAALFLSQLVMAALNYVLMALVVSVISNAFRTCTGWVPAAAGAPRHGEDER